MCSGELHTSVPGELVLLLEELDAREDTGGWGGGEELVGEGDGDGEGCWAETDAEEV